MVERIIKIVNCGFESDSRDDSFCWRELVGCWVVVVVRRDEVLGVIVVVGVLLVVDELFDLVLVRMVVFCFLVCCFWWGSKVFVLVILGVDVVGVILVLLN